jgi:hypothetical protein
MFDGVWVVKGYAEKNSMQRKVISSRYNISGKVMYKVIFGGTFS